MKYGKMILHVKVLAIKPDNISSNPRNGMMEEENWLQQAGT